MKQLYRKLSVAMLAIVLLLGGAFYILERISVKLYYEELSQRLNSSLAMYVVNAKPLITDGVTDTDALAELANRAMVINPTAEIYLLDTDGNILGHELPDDAVTASQVNLEPIQELLGGSTQFPIKGDDPSNPGESKVFSVSPVMDGNDAAEPRWVICTLCSAAHSTRQLPARCQAVTCNAWFLQQLPFSC